MTSPRLSVQDLAKPPKDAAMSMLVTQIVAHIVSDTTDDLAAWLCRVLDCKRLENPTDDVVLDGPSGMRCGLLRDGDPTNTAVQVGFLIIGPEWPHVLTGMLEAVNASWKKKKKKKLRSAKPNHNGGPLFDGLEDGGAA
jgi:hypothetical protein